MTKLHIPTKESVEFRQLIDNMKKLDGVKLADAIPKDLYQPRLWRGMLSFATNYILYFSALVAIAYAPHWSLYLPLFLVAGLGGWGLFCVAHDCGHHSFSRSKRLNYAIGHISLIPLLYPFHGWRHMHNMHHANTNSFEMDTDWRPVMRVQYDRMSLWEKFVYHSTRSWAFWLGTVNYQRHSGFRPSMFAKMEARNEVRRSILFNVIVAAIAFPILIYFTGISGFFLYFLGPWVGIHAWFSLTTMMHHISNETPFLTKDHWTMNGSRLLLTTDYMYPSWLLFLTNYITVHTAHHVAPIIPHYNLMKAQSALKEAYPDLLRIKPLTVKDVWHVIRNCHLYDPVTGYYESFGQHQSHPAAGANKASQQDNKITLTRLTAPALTVKALSVISPALAGRKATDIFANTRSLIKKPPKDTLPLGAQRFTISGVPGISHGYVWGKEDKTILLVHGWGANSSSMYSFTRVLRQCGFRVAAFDAPAHGISPGTMTTLTEFQNAVMAVITTLGNVVGVVAHSLGGIAATGAIAKLQRENTRLPDIRALALISAPATLPAVIDRWQREAVPLSPSVAEVMRAELWQRNGVPVEHWNIPELGRDINAEILLMHDKNDTTVPVCEAEVIGRQIPDVEPELTQGLGHIRILADNHVLQRVAGFMEQTCQDNVAFETDEQVQVKAL
ncbi:alpha/beta fold hydrolase [Gynuella sp.]|uniref:alpha/beta fold hydrolase n=1 Tax=Gynuella sp. TaxID=2969146 RepID=UPI003D14F647